jgi:hypothetical protein
MQILISFLELDLRSNESYYEVNRPPLSAAGPASSGPETEELG